MADTGTCPHCDEQFTVTAYGRGLSCPSCGGRIDVTPDPEIWLDTPIGTIGVAGLKKVFG